MSNVDLDASTYPWEKESLIYRLSKLFTKGDKEIVVYIYENADNSTFRYRAYNMCEVMEQSSKISGTYFFVKELDTVIKYLDLISHIVIVRTKWTIELDRLFCKVYSKNIRMYYDVDDLIYDIKKLPLVMNTINVPMDETNYNGFFSYASRLYLAASMCENFISTNEFIANKLHASFNKKVHVIENFLNKQQMEVSDLLWKDKLQETKSKDEILLGYFSGSPSHNLDFQSISSELYTLMKNNDKIKLRLVGYLTLPEILEEYNKEGRVERLPMQHYANLQKKIAECDVNLIPLLVNEFTNCKSEIKYFESGIVGTVSVAAPTFVYKKIINDGENGYLSLPGTWQEKIEKIIENRPNKEVAKAARDFAEKNYDGRNLLTKIENVFLDNNAD